MKRKQTVSNRYFWCTMTWVSPSSRDICSLLLRSSCPRTSQALWTAHILHPTYFYDLFTCTFVCSCRTSQAGTTQIIYVYSKCKHFLRNPKDLFCLICLPTHLMKRQFISRFLTVYYASSSQVRAVKWCRSSLLWSGNASVFLPLLSADRWKLIKLMHKTVLFMTALSYSSN